MLGFVVSSGLIVLWLEVESIWYNCHRNDDFTNTDTEYKGMTKCVIFNFLLLVLSTEAALNLQVWKHIEIGFTLHI